MSSRPVRFVHASDLHLERPLGGVDEVPDHLTELFLESAYVAAEQVFETVLSEGAELLVLSGDVLHADRTGPRGPLFLVEQMQRLAEREIPVYWAGGPLDPPEAWPHPIALPANVHRFPVGRVETFQFHRDGEPVVQLSGTSVGGVSTQQPPRSTSDIFRVAVAHTSAEPAELITALATEGASLPATLGPLASEAIDYWALGGQANRSTVLSGHPTAHFPGSPQGRTPDEVGPHGCTVVDVDATGAIRTRLCPTDTIRWLDERIIVDEAAGRETLVAMLRERMHTLRDTMPGLDLLVRWTIAGSGPLLARLRDGGLADSLLKRLRDDFGHGPPAAWSVGIDVEPTAMLPGEWYEQETIRGDYLRALREIETNPAAMIDLARDLPDDASLAQLRAELPIGDQAKRRRLLHEAALLGVDLLTGEESES